MEIAPRIAADLTIEEGRVQRTIALLDEGNTIPFIARYRKEVTGSLTDLEVETIEGRLRYLRELDRRKEMILKRISEQGKLTEELAAQIEAVQVKAELEDLYLPFRKKKKSRASEAITRGLTPLADLIWAQGVVEGDQELIAGPYVNEGLGVANANQAWQGARDIVAERVAESAPERKWLREHFLSAGVIESRVDPAREADGPKYRDYFHWDEPAARIPSHRLLAIRRGEREGILRYRIFIERDAALVRLRKMILIEGGGDLGEHLHLAIEDAYDRLLAPSIEKEARRILREKADAEAIDIFGKNLKNLLMAAPLGPKRVLGIDPGLRTGCKLAAIDEQGDILATGTIYPHLPQKKVEEAGQKVLQEIKEHRLVAVAIGNGTGGRETDALLREILAGDPEAVKPDVIMVNESGASVYSASKEARKELPDLDVSLRGAVSIARRLQDPLAELVKIEPKSIGVGQYQHDVNQNQLLGSLARVVEDCVNAVGVEVNTASPALLAYVAGIGPALAESIAAHRAANGPFVDRGQLLSVPQMGPKAFEQSAGFLRIRNAKNPLDSSAVHPERYELVGRMAASVDADLAGLMGSSEIREKIRIADFVDGSVGEPTLQDILAELEKPGRDPRDTFEPISFDPEITKLDHLTTDKILEGVVTNVTAFGAFVDIGVHQDGLVHISELSHNFVKDPASLVEVGQRVRVMVIEVDKERKRISLSIKAAHPAPKRPPRPASPKTAPVRAAPPKTTQSRTAAPNRTGGPGTKPASPGGRGPRQKSYADRGNQERRPPNKAENAGRPKPPQSRPNPDNPFAKLVVAGGKVEWKGGEKPKKM